MTCRACGEDATQPLDQLQLCDGCRRLFYPEQFGGQLPSDRLQRQRDWLAAGGSCLPSQTAAWLELLASCDNEAAVAQRTLDQIYFVVRRHEDQHMGRENLRYDSVQFTLLRYAYNHYLALQNLSCEEGRTTTMRQLWDWLKRWLAEEETVQAWPTVLATYGITHEELVAFVKVCQDAFAFIGMVYDMWPMLTHGDLAAQHYPRAVKVYVVYEFADRDLTYLQQVLPVSQDLPITQAYAMTMVRRLGYEMSQRFGDISLDQMYANATLRTSHSQ